MTKTKSSETGPGRTIFLLFIVFFAILYFVFQPDDFSSVLIPFIISLSLAYLFGIWMFSQEI